MTALKLTEQPITTTVLLVDPAIAARWLEHNNSHNRELRQSRVDEYKREMLAGRWHFNGESIQFDKDGVLLNGQHRLWAIVDSGCSQKFVIVRGLEPASQVTMDQGTRRTPAEQLELVGIKVDNTVAATIRVYLRWQQGRLFGDQVRVRTSTAEVVEWAQRNPDAIELIHGFTTAGIRRVPALPSITLATALRFHEIDYEQAADFFSRLATGAELTTNSPILALRNRLLKVKEANTVLSQRDAIAYFIMAWNAERTGRQLAKLQRPKGAAWSTKNFPVPK
jgi:hypothetical protein